jgi:hypothetical protein
MVDPNDYLAGLSFGSAAPEESKVLGGIPAKVVRTTGLRAAEGRDGRRAPLPMRGTVSEEGRFYPSSGLGAGGDGYTEEDVAKLLRGMPPERIAQIQRTMQAAGLMAKGYRPGGFVDSDTRSAFKEVLLMSNGRGSTYIATLGALASGAESAEEMRKASARRLAEMSFQTRLNTFEASDPAGVRQTAEQAFRQALGRKPRQDEMERFVSGFLGRERGAQQAVFDVQDSMDRAERQQRLSMADYQDSLDSQGAPPLGTESGGEADVLWQRLQKMIADAPGKITPGPRSRDLATQQRLYARYKAGKGPMAAKPGTSKHGNGRANDLKYENDAVRQWALKNAHRYGLSFPIYNPKLGRSRDESWHVEVAKGSLPAGHSIGDGHDHGAAGGQAPISQNVTVQRQDVGAQALEFARNANPTETAAYEIGSTFDQLLSMVQKGLR